MDQNIPTGHEFSTAIIPEGTTFLVQTLDVYGFRLIKAFMRRISDWVLMYSIDVQLFQRNNVIKMVSLTHNQFHCPRFENMWKYSWFKAGYLDERPLEFQTPAHHCFATFTAFDLCCYCAEPAFIRCAWCKTLLCFRNFWGGADQFGHYCEHFLE